MKHLKESGEKSVYIFLILSILFGYAVTCNADINNRSITRFEIKFKANTNCRVKLYWISEEVKNNGNKEFNYRAKWNDYSIKSGWAPEKKINSIRIHFYYPLHEKIEIKSFNIKYGNQTLNLTPYEILEYTTLSTAFEIVKVKGNSLILISRKTTASPNIIFALSSMLARKIRKENKEFKVKTEVKFIANVNKKTLLKLYYTDSSRLSFNNNYELIWLGDTSRESTNTTILRTKKSIHSLAFYFSRQDSVHLNIKEISINDGSNFVKFSAKDIYNNFFTSDNLGMYLADSNTIKLKSYYLDNNRYYTLSTNNIFSPLSIKFHYTLNIVANLPANSLIKVNYYDTRPNNYYYFQHENVRHYYNTVANDFNNYTFNINTERELLGFKISLERVDSKESLIESISLCRGQETQNWNSKAIIENFEFSDNADIDISNSFITLYDETKKSNKFIIESNKRFLFRKDEIRYIIARSIEFSILTLLLFIFNLQYFNEKFREKLFFNFPS